MIPRFQPPVGLGEIVAALHPGGVADIEDFERAFADCVQQKYAIAFPYGRTGLLALLKALGLKGKRVICPAYTCVVVPNAIVMSGNIPDFIDSKADANGDLDEASSIAATDVGALIATSIFGNPVDLDALDRFRKSHPQIPIIQDCAHSFLCEWKGRSVPRTGDAAIFGLNISKTMTSIFGGMVTTDDSLIARRVYQTRSEILSRPGWTKSALRAAYLLAVYPAFHPLLFGLTERLRQTGVLDRFTRYYDEDKIELPHDHLLGLTRLEARVGRHQCSRLASQIAARQRYAEVYRERIRELDRLSFVASWPGASFSHIAARVADKRAVMLSALSMGVQLGEVIEYSVPEMPAYQSYRRAGANWPVAQALSQQIINLPLSGTFNHRTADRVCEVMQRILENAPTLPDLPFTSGH